MFCSDWWAFEILIVISGLFGVADQATFVVVANIAAMIFMTPLGISEAACVIVGNSIGEKNASLAWRYFKLAIVITVTNATIIAIVLIGLREQVASIFTQEQEVLALLVKCIPILALKFIPDSYQALGNGVIRALGK